MFLDLFDCDPRLSTSSFLTERFLRPPGLGIYLAQSDGFVLLIVSVDWLDFVLLLLANSKKAFFSPLGSRVPSVSVLLLRLFLPPRACQSDSS